ncbi:MAG: hypothetical protein V3U09_05035 [Thermoplasmata archaeon]
MNHDLPALWMNPTSIGSGHHDYWPEEREKRLLSEGSEQIRLFDEDAIEDSPEGIWNAHHNDLAISEIDFFKYLEGSAIGFAIKIISALRYDPRRKVSMSILAHSLT